MTNTSGTIVAEYTYDAYGNITSMSGSQAADNPIRFSTKYFDGNTGYYDFGFRSYDPVTGRWLNRDPIGESGGLNLYGFVGNSPNNYVDTNGLAKRPENWGPDKIAIVFNSFIPTPYAQAPIINNPLTGTFQGDNRSYSCTGGTYRTMHTIVINTKTGETRAWEDAGLSVRTGGMWVSPQVRPAHNRRSLKTYVNADKVRGGWNIHIEGNAKNGLTNATMSPGITYRMQIHVTPNGSTNMYIPTLDDYPAFELWKYQGNSAKLLFGQKPAKLGSVLQIIPGFSAR